MTDPSSSNGMTPYSGEPPAADRDWFGGRRWTGIAAIGMVLLIAVAVLIVVLGTRHHSTPHHTQQAAPPPPPNASAGTTRPPATTSSTVSSSAVSASSTPLSTAPLTAAPKNARWSIYQGVALPSIAGAGPAQTRGAIATGYVHTPTGALVAAVNEGYRYALAPDKEFRQAAAQMLARGSGYYAWLKLRAASPYGASGAGGQAGDSGLAQVAAFQFVSYTPQLAVIQIVTRDSDGNLQESTWQVAWTGGDWKFVTAPSGGQSVTIQKLQDLTGFIAWSGI